MHATTEELKSELADTKILDTDGFYEVIGQRPDLYLPRADLIERLETKRLVVDDGRVKVRNNYRALGVWKGAQINVEGPYGSNLLDLTWQLVSMCKQENHAPEIGVGFWKKLESLETPIPLKSTWAKPPAPARGYVGYVSRAKWGARYPKSANSTNVRNGYVKAHWTVTCQPGDHSKCNKHIQGIQNYHMDSYGWNDIAYSELICSHGYVYCGRGPGARSAANGDGQLNYEHEAISLIGGPDCGPTTAQKHALYARMDERACVELLGHRDGYSTSCPGDEIQKWVRAYHPIK